MSIIHSEPQPNREQVILSHLPQVALLAHRLHSRCSPAVEIQDLISAGVIGLIQAVDRFDPARDCLLKTIAEHRIRGAMLDYLRQLDPLPRSVRHFVRQREQARRTLDRNLCRPADESELAEGLALSLKRYRQLDRIARAAETRSLDAMPESALYHSRNFTRR